MQIFHIFFFLFILQSSFNYVQAMSYLECKNNGILNISYNTIFDSSDIIGARGAGCNITCAQRYLSDFICYSDVGFYYDIWYWSVFFAYIITFIWSSYCSYQIYKSDNNKFTTTPQIITSFGIVFTIILRFIWLCGIYNGRTPDVFNGFPIFDAVISKTAQTLHLILFLGIILVWRNIVDSSTTLTRIDNNKNIKTFKYIFYLYLSMAIILLPISIISQLWFPRLGVITGIIFIGFFIILMGSSIKYSFAINKILNNKPTHSKLIYSIKIMNNTFFIIGIFEIILIICIFLRLFINPYTKLFVNWTLIHTLEIIFLNLFSSTISHKARHPNIIKHNLSFNISTNLYNKTNTVVPIS